MLMILKIIYLLLPAYMANMAPVFVRRVRLFDFPVDLGIKLGRKPVFGKNKTFRGFVFGIFSAMAVALIQYDIMEYDFFANLSVVDYSQWILVGLLLGGGALFGDLVKSFIKRRYNISPGKPFIPWDQVDYTFGALLFILVLYVPTLLEVIIAVVLSFIFHVAANHIGYYLKIRKEKW